MSVSCTSSPYFKSEFCQGSYFISMCCLSLWRGWRCRTRMGGEKWLSTEATSCPREFTRRLSRGSVLLFWVCGSCPYSPTHPIGRKQKIDSAEEGKCVTPLCPVLICCSPCLYLTMAHAWARDTQVLGVTTHPVLGEAVKPNRWLQVF